MASPWHIRKSKAAQVAVYSAHDSLQQRKWQSTALQQRKWQSTEHLTVYSNSASGSLQRTRPSTAAQMAVYSTFDSLQQRKWQSTAHSTVYNSASGSLQRTRQSTTVLTIRS